jgi:hypothetical protein
MIEQRDPAPVSVLRYPSGRGHSPTVGDPR